MNAKFRTIEEILHVISINKQFSMVTGLHGVSITVEDDSLHIHPFVQNPSWDGWRNFVSPTITISPTGEIFVIHDDEYDWQDEDGNLHFEESEVWNERLTEKSHPSNFISVNRYDWGQNYFSDDAHTVKAYILHVAAMWAAYNKKEVNA